MRSPGWTLAQHDWGLLRRDEDTDAEDDREDIGEGDGSAHLPRRGPSGAGESHVCHLSPDCGTLTAALAY